MSGVPEVETVLQPHNEESICQDILAQYDSLEWREYGNENPKRGRAVIANFMEFKWEAKARYGSNKDVTRLKSSLGSHKFDVDEWNLKGVDADPFMRMVKEEAAKEDHLYGDCFVMVIMTHGDVGGTLLAYENTFQLDDVVECFTGDKCPNLLLKPKIFIVQACRGSSGHLAVVVSKCKATSPPPPLNTITRPTHSDIVIAQSQYEGFYSLRDFKKGSYFIQTLCYVLEKDFEKPNHLKDDFLRLLTFTAHMVACYEFWEIKKSKNQSDGSTDGASGEKEEEKEQKLDFQDPSHDSESAKTLEIDARPFPTNTISTKLIKQQPTVVSTLLRLFYLREKNIEENKMQYN